MKTLTTSREISKLPELDIEWLIKYSETEDNFNRDLEHILNNINDTSSKKIRINPKKAYNEIIDIRKSIATEFKIKIHLKANWKTNEVWLNGKQLHPEESLKIINHSPDGFNWGYPGSGPAQLALAICLELFGYFKARKVYQDFKWKYITPLPQTDIDRIIDVQI